MPSATWPRLRGLDADIADSIETKPYLTTQQMNDEATAWGHRFSMEKRLPALAARCGRQPLGGARRRLPDGAFGGYSVWSCGGRSPPYRTARQRLPGETRCTGSAAETEWDEPELDDACRAWGRQALAEAQPYESSGRYVNDVAEVEDGLARAIYGDAKYERLVALKREWDPDNVFRLNQNIRP